MSSLHENLVLRFVIQRCSQAEVVIDGKSRGRLGRGLVVLFGVGTREGTSKVPSLEMPAMPPEESVTSSVLSMRPALERCVDKILGLRVFPDAAGKMNLGLQEAQGGLYLISQFTLFADTRKGYRPSFSRAAPPAIAERLFESLVEIATARCGDAPLCTGEFAADMGVSLVNDGPVTLIIDADVGGFL
jgi:D-aminoacyl-tRNA deacylase